MKKIFAKIFACMMGLAMCFAGVGCLGVGDGFDFFNDLFARFQNGDISEEEYYRELADMDTQLYGTKILYRPESYDFDGNSGGTEEEPNDYYGQYAWQILSRLELIYGVSNREQSLTEAGMLYGYYTFNDATLPYLYDSIRYQVDERQNVTSRIEISENDGQLSFSEPSATNSVILSANLDNDWNWSFAINSDDNTRRPYLYENVAATIIKQTDSQIFTLFDGLIFESNMSAYYSGEQVATNYLTTYVGANKDGESAPDDYDNYSDYVKALEYAIYRYAIDLEPGTVKVDPSISTVTNEDGTTTKKYYSVQIIETQNGIQTTYSVDEALEKAQADFNELGGFVGISERNRRNLSNWIINNVIGSQAMENDKVTIWSDVVQVSYNKETGYVKNLDELNAFLRANGYQGEEVTEDDVTISAATSSQETVGRDYEYTVANMVELVCDQVSIGNNGEEGGNVNVDDRYLASEIKEYWGPSFVSGGDEDPFPYYEDFSTVTAGAPVIQPLEYQNVLFMFNTTVNVTAITLTFQYDADLDGYGTATGNDIDENRYLTIEVSLNFYDHETDTLTTVGSKTVNIPDGKMQDPWGSDAITEAERRYAQQHGTSITFSQTASFGVDESIMGRPSQDLIVGPFNTEIGNGILMTDVGRNDYQGNPLVSKTPLTLTGNSRVKDYYSIIEPTDEQIANGETYLTGQLNSEMFAGNDGCDYLEVVYRVIKRVGDTETNYKFYTSADVIADIVR